MDFNPRKDMDRTAGLSIFQSDVVEFLKQTLLGIAMAFSTPLESILRYDFGERYYSKANYISGITTLTLWLFIIGGFSKLFAGDVGVLGFGGASGPDGRISGLIYNFFAMLTGGDYSSYALFSGILGLLLYGHIVLGAYHFFRMWYRGRTGRALHSFDTGKSRLNFVTRWLFKPINRVANAIVKFLSTTTIPSHLRKDDSRLTPVFQSEEHFTKLYLEPAIGIGLWLWFLANGFGVFGLYLLFAGVGLGFVAKTQALMDEGTFLDWRDQMIDQTFTGQFKAAAGEHEYAEKRRMSPRAKDAAYQMSKIVENQPDLAKKVQRENSSLFDMMEDLNPNLRKVASNGDGNATIINNHQES